MSSTEAIKTLVQCDFDGTITDEDVSFQVLDAFADGDWRRLLNEYREEKIPVGTFNRKAFAMVRADKQTLLDFMFNRANTEIRPGFGELLDCCSRRGFRFVIVSNGLDFYIEELLKDVGLEGIEIFAAQTRFSADGVQVKYVGPGGKVLEKGFKDAYTELFLGEGYRVIYIGNGISDFSPARLSHRMFATGELLDHCREKNVACTAFNDLNDVVRELDLL